MDPITFHKDKFVVLSKADGEIQLVPYTTGATIYPGAGVTQVDDFDDPLEAIRRVKELGGKVADTRTFWPQGKVPTESGGALAWADLPEPVQA